MNEVQDDGAAEISLLDLLVAIAENWLLIVFVPLIAGIIAYGALRLSTPSQFQSDALLRMSAEETVMLHSERVLDTPEINAALTRVYGEPASTARATFVQQGLSIEKRPPENLYKLTVRASTPEGAYQLLTAIIDSLVANSTPTESQAKNLKLQRTQVESSLEELESGLARLNRLADNEIAVDSSNTDIASGEFGQALVSILDKIKARQDELSRIDHALSRAVTRDDIVQSPALSRTPMPRSLAAPVVMVVLAVGFLTLIAAFIRTGFSNARSKEAIGKINRIRRAFWLKPIDSPQ